MMDSVLFSKANELFRHYHGVITSTDKSIRIEHKNLLHDERGNIYKCVPCYVEIGLCGPGAACPFYSDAQEQTLQILGGVGCPCDSVLETIETARDQLKRFQFQERSVCYEQLSLF